MTSETEIRSRPLQRQAGFNVSQNGNDNNMKSSTSPSRIRTTTGDTVVRGSFDGDVEMGEEKRVVYPVPILRSQDLLKSNNDENGKDSDRSRNDLPTPPDHVGYNAKLEDERKTQLGSDVKLPSLHSSLISPRIATISSSHVSSGPASISSAQWSPGHSSDPHLYSISGQPYSNASVRPYLSTSFQTSAERGSGIVRGPPNASGLLPRQPQNDVMDDDDDDVFGNTAQGLGLHNTGEPSPPQLRRSNDMDREEGDAAGVFSFSSPYFGPRSLETADVPPLSPPPPGNDSRSSAYAQRMMSPSWTAATLGKLSLGGSSAEGTSSTSRRPPYGTSPRNTMANAHAAYSRSLPSGAAGLPIGGQARRSSFQKRPAPGPGLLHPHSSYYKSTGRARSTSRSRPERSTRTMENVDDDDETDEDEQMVSREQDDDDDATEDEAEPQNHARYEKRYSRPEEAGYIQQPHRHPSGQPTTMSASYERAQSGLSRQYSSDRYAHLGMSRHHPYAASPSGASPSNGSILASYSPNNSRVPIGRRRSSFGQGAMLSGSPSNGMMHALSHSPRYIQSIPTRDRPPIGSYTSASGGDYSHYAGSLPQHAQHSNLSGYGESPDANSSFNTSRRRYEVYGDEEEEEEDEEESRPDHRRSNGNNGKSTHRSTSANRAVASAGGAGGDVDSPEMLEVNAIRERLGGAANCSAFISKLWYLMCRPELYSKYIHWSESGDSVILSNDPDINNEFASEVLPKLFKHGNNASFVRQLNLYGFQRVPSSRLLDAAEIKAARRYANGNNISTALQLYGPHSSFAHPRFKKDQESLLPSMKPRSSKKTKKGGNQGDLSGGRGDSDVGEDEFAL